MVPVIHDHHFLISISCLIVVHVVVVRVDPHILIILLRRVPVNGNERRERIGHGVVVCIADADEAEEREKGNNPFTGLRPFFLMLDLGFPPDVGDVRTGAGRDNTLDTMGSIPGGVGVESVEVYVGVGVGAEVYRYGDTGNATACVECVEVGEE
jgi:hypothetical protein